MQWTTTPFDVYVAHSQRSKPKSAGLNVSQWLLCVSRELFYWLYIFSASYYCISDSDAELESEREYNSHNIIRAVCFCSLVHCWLISFAPFLISYYMPLDIFSINIQFMVVVNTLSHIIVDSYWELCSAFLCHDRPEKCICCYWFQVYVCRVYWLG